MSAICAVDQRADQRECAAVELTCSEQIENRSVMLHHKREDAGGKKLYVRVSDKAFRHRFLNEAVHLLRSLNFRQHRRAHGWFHEWHFLCPPKEILLIVRRRALRRAASSAAPNHLFD